MNAVIALYMLVLGSTWSALAAAEGIPICAPGLLSCGTAGCYSSLLTNCMEWQGKRQCQPIGILQQLSLMVSASNTRRCHMGYVNTCGTDFCSNDELCSMQGCVLMPTTNGSSAAAAAAAMRQAGSSPRDMCYAARSSSAACRGDSSDLQKVPCNSIGVALVPGVTCFQSTLFNCAASEFQEIVHTCRGLAMVADAVREVINSTVAAAEAADGTNASTAVAASAAAGDEEQEQPRTPRWRRQPKIDQPLLQPVFEGLANVVSDVSKSIFNISVPPTGSQRGAALAGSSSSSSSSSGSSSGSSSESGFYLVPPAGIRNSATSSSCRSFVVSPMCCSGNGWWHRCK
ncbi:hypothetical protein COO60DRAFT_150070 [Scenedesmus sp. NREL 46B-D3]|nr:hypothetical protein COO60DRAFT_150070 [Scenedesmus sp. NREL 46B-D3]